MKTLNVELVVLIYIVVIFLVCCLIGWLGAGLAFIGMTIGLGILGNKRNKK